MPVDEIVQHIIGGRSPRFYMDIVVGIADATVADSARSAVREATVQQDAGADEQRAFDHPVSGDVYRPARQSLPAEQPDACHQEPPVFLPLNGVDRQV